jgi:hypothetical protein
MTELIWKSSMQYYSQSDEASFLSWLQSIPGVVRTEGRGRELAIYLRSKRLSEESLRELIAIYKRYHGNMAEVSQFEDESNTSWFKTTGAYWHEDVFGDSKNV